jgi:activating signal cointegrator complex subunit 2
MAQKSEVKQLRRTYEQYEYEDEYDDSYDTFQAVGDADGEGLDPIQPNPNRPTLRQRDADDANDESSAAKAAGEGNNENEEDNEDDDDDGSTQQRRRPGLPAGRAPVAGRGRGSVGRGKQPPAAAPSSSASRGGGAAGRGAGAAGGGGRGRGRGGRGRGGPAGDDMSDRQKLLKDRHKSRLANHDRKQRALKKKGTTLPPPM